MPGLSPQSVEGATAAVVSKGGEAAAVKPMAGGAAIVPLPLTGGKKRKGTRRLSKKVIKMLKAMPKKKLAKLMKGGVGETGEDEAETAPAMGGKKKGKTARKSRRSGLFY
jgi:hypothetical protein